MELEKVFETLNEALARKDMTIWCQQKEIESLKNKIEEMEKKNEICK